MISINQGHRYPFIRCHYLAMILLHALNVAHAQQGHDAFSPTAAPVPTFVNKDRPATIQISLTPPPPSSPAPTTTIATPLPSFAKMPQPENPDSVTNESIVPYPNYPLETPPYQNLSPVTRITNDEPQSTEETGTIILFSVTLFVVFTFVMLMVHLGRCRCKKHDPPASSYLPDASWGDSCTCQGPPTSMMKTHLTSSFKNVTRHDRHTSDTETMEPSPLIQHQHHHHYHHDHRHHHESKLHTIDINKGERATNISRLQRVLGLPPIEARTASGPKARSYVTNNDDSPASIYNDAKDDMNDVTRTGSIVAILQSLESNITYSTAMLRLQSRQARKLDI
jgi:hypothetical protein